VGTDVFVDWDEHGRDPEVLASHLIRACRDGLDLRMITNRGVKVWPDGFPETFCTDHWRCRYQADRDVEQQELVELLGRLTDLGVDVIKTENLYTFDGEPGFSLGQGQ
jgi:isocitrate dehydrogenase